MSSRRSPRTIDAWRRVGERDSCWKSASASRASSFACRTGARMNDDPGPRSSMTCFRWSYLRRSTDPTVRFGETVVNQVEGRASRRHGSAPDRPTLCVNPKQRRPPISRPRAGARRRCGPDRRRPGRSSSGRSRGSRRGPGSGRHGDGRRPDRSPPGTRRPPTDSHDGCCRRTSPARFGSGCCRSTGSRPSGACPSGG